MFYKTVATISLLGAIVGSMEIAGGNSNFMVWVATTACWVCALVLFLWRE